MTQEPLRDLKERWNDRDARSPSQAPKARSAGAKRRAAGAKPRAAGPKARSAAPPPPAPMPNEADIGGALRRLSTPRPVRVRPGTRGTPAAINATPVEAILEEWFVEDRWWTGKPVRRRYFELVLSGGRNTVVFKDLVGGGWFTQRA